MQSIRQNYQHKRQLPYVETFAQSTSFIILHVFCVLLVYKGAKGRTRQIEKLIQEVKANVEQSEAIDSLLIFPITDYIVSLNSSAFELLENRGIDLISNETLRKEIVSYFKYDQQKLLDKSKAWQVILLDFGLWYDVFLDPIVDQQEIKNYTLGSERFKTLNYANFRSNPLLISRLKYRIHRKVRERNSSKKVTAWKPDCRRNIIARMPIKVNL